jgi:hypothetical protein
MPFSGVSRNQNSGIDQIGNLDDHLHTPGGLGCANLIPYLPRAKAQPQRHRYVIGYQGR